MEQIKGLISKIFKQKKLDAYTDKDSGAYMVLFFRTLGNKRVRIDRKRIKISEKKFRYKGQDFTLFNFKDILFSDTKCNYYGFDYDTQKQLVFNESGELPNGITLEEIDNYVNAGIISQLIDDLEKPQNGENLKMILWIIIGAVIGGLIGYVVGSSNSIPVEIVRMAI